MTGTPLHGPAGRTRPILGAAGVLAGLLAGCSPTGPTEPGDEVVAFDLTVGDHGWEGGFADYAADQVASVDPVFGRRELPADLDVRGEALFMAGTNVSDDLFMFLRRPIADLEPEVPYEVRFEVEIATRAPSGCAGAGGAPGEAVTLKAGATPERPRVVPAEDGGEETFLVMNVDKGEQASGGPDAVVLGDIANGSTACLEPEWRRKTLRSDLPVRTRTDAEGHLWLLVGTDSGFEGRTGLFYLRIRAVLERG